VIKIHQKKQRKNKG